MDRIKTFLRREAVLCAAAALAAITLFFVPPDGAYLAYVDFSTLGLLFSLMLSVAGLAGAGVFRALTRTITRRVSSARGIVLILVLLCFFSAAFITNDVALITFVPFTTGLLGTRDHRRLIGVIVAETVAANLGSLATPMGNPQNLYLFHFYSLTVPEFLRVMLPLGAAALVLCLVLAFLIPKGEPPTAAAEDGAFDRGRALLWGAMFLLCVLSVADLLPWQLCLAAVVLAALSFDRRLFAKADYSLLATFVCFFIFVGNLARIDAVSRFLRGILAGRELTVSALASQVVSNVPAAAMLAPFTENAAGLLWGVNIGGLGTLIASMASLISYRCYSALPDARRGAYFGVFTAVNFALLALLLGLCALLPP